MAIIKTASHICAGYYLHVNATFTRNKYRFKYNKVLLNCKLDNAYLKLLFWTVKVRNKAFFSNSDNVRVEVL